MYDVTAALNELNEQGQEGGGTLQLADSQLKEYHRIKEEAGLKTAKLRDEKEVYDSQQQADVEAQKNLEENLQELINREQQLASQQEQMQARLKRLLDSFGKNTDELSKVQSELGQMQDRHRKSRSVLNTVCNCFFLYYEFWSFFYCILNSISYENLYC